MGYLRFFFALTVTIAHLWSPNITGAESVFGFYCISGFLMTKIIHEIYGSTTRGKVLFLLNRFIRIYPTYYLCLIIGVFCLVLVPESSKLNPFLTLPKSWLDWLPQIFIFGLNDITKNLNPIGMESLYPIRILAPAWSLNIELLYYVWMCLIIGTSFRRTVLWYIGSLSINTYLLWNNYPYDYHYFTLYNPSICFAASAMLYHFKPLMAGFHKVSAKISILVGSSLAFIPYLLGFSIHDCPAYLYIIIPVYLYIIFCLDTSGSTSKREQLAADLSYPLFLLHWPISTLFMNVFTPNTFAFWSVTTGLSLYCSYIIVRTTSYVFGPIRNKIRNAATP